MVVHEGGLTHGSSPIRSLIQTNIRYDYLLGRLTRGGHNVLYMGDTGVGKSVVMEKYLENASNTDEFVAYTMKYSAQTKPTNLKDMFETKLEKKRKTLFGPPSGKKMLFFIDDLNMPALEVWCCGGFGAALFASAAVAAGATFVSVFSRSSTE